MRSTQRIVYLLKLGGIRPTGLSLRLYRGRPFSHDHSAYAPSKPPGRFFSSLSAPSNFKSQGFVPARQFARCEMS